MLVALIAAVSDERPAFGTHLRLIAQFLRFRQSYASQPPAAHAQHCRSTAQFLVSRQSYGSKTAKLCVKSQHRERRKTIRGDEDGVFYSVSRKVRRPAAAADWRDSNV